MVRYISLKETKEQTKTPEFKKWFGKSKVVDKSGKPLVVYHGSNVSFKSFEQDRIGGHTGNYGHYGYGFYFSDDPREAKGYGNNIFPVYVKMEKPFYGGDVKYLSKYAKEFGGYEKVNVAIDKNWLLKELKKIDNTAYILASLIFKSGYEKGWEYFVKDNKVPDSKLDLNDVSEWVLATDPTQREEVSEYIINDIEENLGNPKFIQDYPYHSTPIMHYMTGLGSSQSKELTNKIKKDGYDGIIVGSELVVFESNQIKSAIGNNGNFDPRSNNILEGIE